MSAYDLLPVIMGIALETNTIPWKYPVESVTTFNLILSEGGKRYHLVSVFAMVLPLSASFGNILSVSGICIYEVYCCVLLGTIPMRGEGSRMGRWRV